MTEPTKHDESDLLDALFEQAQNVAPAPSEALLARIAADAAQLQPVVSPQIAEPEPELGLRMQLRQALGGWTGIGGLATATVAGLFLGFSQPSLVALTSLATADTAFETGEDWADAEVWPDDDLFFEEG